MEEDDEDDKDKEGVFLVIKFGIEDDDDGDDGGGFVGERCC